MAMLFRELKRRNVFKVATVYVIAAWLLLQVADVLFPALTLPEWSIRFMTAFLILGFPVALIFAWAFELTPDGLKRESNVDRSESVSRVTGRKIDFAIIALLAVAVVYFAADKYVFTSSEPVVQEGNIASEPGIVSIAVLPFADMSAEQDQEYFSDGISEELLNLLAKIDRFRVAGRTSSFSFKNSSDDLRTIGEKLNVDTVLEGSVRKSGNKVRITAQLINTDDGYHIWSETYDRELNDIFQVQDEISQAVVSALKVTLLGDEQSILSSSMTSNVQAYDMYLLGRHEFHKRNKASLEKARKYFQTAIDLDPDFALAYTGLADSNLFLLRSPNSYGDLSHDEVAAVVNPAIDKALSLDPDLAEAHASRGLWYFNLGMPQESVVHLERAIALKPNYAMAHMWYGLVTGMIGAHKKSLPAFRKTIELEPLLAIGHANLGQQLLIEARYDEATRANDFAISIAPNFSNSYTQRMRIAAMQGRLADAVIEARKIFDLWPDQTYGGGSKARIALDMGIADTEEFSKGILLARVSQFVNGEYEEFPNEESAISGSKSYQAFIARNLAILHMYAGDYQQALAEFEKAERSPEIFEPMLINAYSLALGGMFGVLDLAMLYQLTGAVDKARERLGEAGEFLEFFEQQGVNSLGIDYAWAQYYAQMGDDDQALAYLKKAIDRNWNSAWRLRLHPAFERLRQRPGFDELLSIIDARVAEQRQLLAQMDAN